MTADDAGESLKGLRNMINCPFCSLPYYAFFFSDSFGRGKAVV